MLNAKLLVTSLLSPSTEFWNHSSQCYGKLKFKQNWCIILNQPFQRFLHTSQLLLLDLMLVFCITSKTTKNARAGEVILKGRRLLEYWQTTLLIWQSYPSKWKNFTTTGTERSIQSVLEVMRKLRSNSKNAGNYFTRITTEQVGSYDGKAIDQVD